MFTNGCYCTAATPDPRASVVLESSEPCGAAGVVVVADDDDWGSVGGGGSTIRFACHCRGCGG